MAFKIVGVKAVVQGLGKFVSDMQQVTRTATDSSRKIALAMQREELASRKLAVRMEELQGKYAKLEAAGTETSTTGRKLSATMGLLTNSLAQSGLKVEGLIAAAEGAGGALATFGTAISAAIPYIGAALVILKALQFQFKIFKAQLKLVTTPLRLVIRGIKELATNVIPKAVTLVARLAKKIGGMLLERLKSLAQAAWEAGKALLSGLGNALRNLASSALNAAVDGLKKLASLLGSVVEIAWEGAVAFQKLEIRFQGLAANEIIAAGSARNFAEAMRFAAYHGAELLGWVQELALASPFTRKDIGDTIAFSMAMGFSSTKAKELTLAIGNFVSGMGLSSQVMESIILQFGQMQAGGKLFGTELRDLARGAFVPVNEIIKKVAESTGQTAEEWQKLAATGATDIQPFFEEFINMANTRFPGAMDRMNKTLEATLQNMREFVTEIIGVRALSPVLDMVSDSLSDAFKKLSTEETINAFVRMGKSVELLAAKLIYLGEAALQAIFGTKDLGQIAQGVAGVIAAIADEMGSIVLIVADSMNQVEKTLGQRALDAFNWGVNIAIGLAQGLVQGAEMALTAAMRAINSLLTSWLVGHSPPKVAPDIDIWGANVLTEWLRGMSGADFNVLKDIQGPLKSALGVLQSAGKLSRGKAGGIFADISEGLIEGLSGGGIDEGIFSDIVKRFGSLGKEINSLIKLEMKLAFATDAVKQAEMELEAARKRNADATVDVFRQTAEYNKLLRAGAQGNVLKAQLARVNAAEMERNISEEQIGVAEDNVQVAQDALNPLQEQVNLQKELLDQLLLIAQERFGFTESAEKTAAALKGVKGGAGGAADAIEDMGDSMLKAGIDAQRLMDKLGIEEDGAGSGIFGTVKKAVLEMFDGVEERWNEEVGGAVTSLMTTFELFKQNAIVPLMVALGLAGNAAAPAGASAVVGPHMGNAGGGGGLAGAFAWVSANANGLADTIKVQVKNAMNTWSNTTWPTMKEKLIEFYEAVSGLARTLGFRGMDMSGGEVTLTGALEAVAGVLGMILDMSTSVITFLDRIVSLVQKLAGYYKTLVLLRGLAGLGGSGMMDLIEQIADPAGDDEEGSQAGAWRIGKTGPRFIHEGEMILPEGVSNMIRSALTSPVSAMPVSGGTTNNQSVQFGDVSVGNQMDMAMLQLVVEGALRNSL